MTPLLRSLPILYVALALPSYAGDPPAIDDPIPGPIPASRVTVAIDTVATGLVAPNWGTFVPAFPGLLFVVDQVGVVKAIEIDSGAERVFLDVSDQLVDLGVDGPNSFDERGLLGLAFHPDYANNGLLYTYQSEPVSGPADFSTIPAGAIADHQSVIAQWTVASPGQFPNPANPDTVVDPSSKRVLMVVDQPQFNHNGGCLEFGPDGMLYIAFGDGGNEDDQGLGHSLRGNGQDLANILGGIARIDPLGNNSANGQYGIPADNPFVGQANVVTELFAYGMRNPFRFSFDVSSPTSPGSGELIVGEVGQNDIEEVSVVGPGDNLGWPIKEGSFFFEQNAEDPGFVTDVIPPGLPIDLVDPLAEYDHDEGLAIIGGFTYRGTAIPALVSRYVFGDYTGRLFHLDENREIVEFKLDGQDSFGLSLLGFGRGIDGEVYVLANETGIPFPNLNGEPTGVVLRFRLAGDPPFANLGNGKPGGGGVVPQLEGNGPMTPGSNNEFVLTDAERDATTTIIAGVGLLNEPFKGGVLVPTPDLLVPAVTDMLGTLTLPFTLPADFAAGISFAVQAWIEDPDASFDLSASNGVLASVQSP